MSDPQREPHLDLTSGDPLPQQVSAEPWPPTPLALHPVAPPMPRYRLALVFLFLTFCTTVLVGSRLQFNFDHGLDAFASGSELLPLFPVHWVWQSPRLLLRGLPFSLAIMSILLAHEMGHYLYCLRYRVRATPPFFVPAPTLIGTLGAFIRILGRIPSRAALFDIALAGPIAGFVIAVPTMLIGLALSRPITGIADPDLQFGFPLIFHLGHVLLHRAPWQQPSPSLAHYYLHPVAVAAWAGMLATALNLLPGGQLDGGHLVFAIAPRMHRYVSWAMVSALVVCSWFFWVGWLVWAILLTLTGLRQPRVPSRPSVGSRRRRLALVALVILALTFTPTPIANANFAHVLWEMRH